MVFIYTWAFNCKLSTAVSGVRLFVLKTDRLHFVCVFRSPENSGYSDINWGITSIVRRWSVTDWPKSDRKDNLYRSLKRVLLFFFSCTDCGRDNWSGSVWNSVCGGVCVCGGVPEGSRQRAPTKPRRKNSWVRPFQPKVELTRPNRAAALSSLWVTSSSVWAECDG